MDEEFLKRHAALQGEIRAKVSTYVGKPLHVHANLGRSKVLDRDGVLLQTYRSLFIIEAKEKRGRTSRQSYQFVDIMTGMVELTDLETGEMLFDFSEDQEEGLVNTEAIEEDLAEVLADKIEEDLAEENVEEKKE